MATILDSIRDGSIQYALQRLSETLNSPQMRIAVPFIRDSSQLALFNAQIDALSLHNVSDMSHITKLNSLHRILAQEKRRVASSYEGMSLVQSCFRALVVAANEYTATRITNELSSLYVVQLLSADNTRLEPEVQICVVVAHSGNISKSVSNPLTDFSVVITLCESWRVRLDPLLLQLTYANRVRHVAIVCDTASSQHNMCGIDDMVAALRNMSSHDKVSGAWTAELPVDTKVLASVMSSTELQTVFDKASGISPGRSTKYYIMVANSMAVRPSLYQRLNKQHNIELTQQEVGHTALDLLDFRRTNGCVLVCPEYVDKCNTATCSQDVDELLNSLTKRYASICQPSRTSSVSRSLV